MSRIGLALLMVAGLSVAVQAGVISGNYCSVAPIADEPAGVVPAFNWNDLTGPAGFGPTGSMSNPKYSDGSIAAGVTIYWSTSDGGSQNTNDYVFRPFPPATLGNHIQDGHDQLMAGYLQASKYSSSEPVITLRLTGLSPAAFGGSYDVIIYFDGDDDVQNTVSRAQIRIWNSLADYQNSLAPLATYYGRDKTGNNFPVDHTVAGFLGDYTQIVSTDEFNPTEGNYVRFSGLTGSEFFVRMVGVAGQHGVAMNGFQVIPEPATVGLMAVGLAALLRRRRSAR